METNIKIVNEYKKLNDNEYKKKRIMNIKNEYQKQKLKRIQKL